MKEKKYPPIKEEPQMACEPIGDALIANNAAVMSNCQDDRLWGIIPAMGPLTEDEAIARIETALREPEKESLSHDAFMQQLKNDYAWLSFCGRK